MLSYLNYAGQVTKLWDNYKKPAIIGETGWDHTFYEPSMPGYQAMYHNALWVSLANGTAMTPFWWAYSGYLNDNIFTNQNKSIARFVNEIPWAKLTGLTRIKNINGGKHAFAIESNQLIYGWIANPESDVTNAEIKITPGKAYTKYKLKLFHTWRGQFLPDTEISSINGTITFTIPTLKIEGGQSKYIGQDVAFILERL